MSKVPAVEDLVARILVCRKARSSIEAKIIHNLLCHHGLETHIVLGNHLVTLFVQCGRISDALNVFQNLTSRTVHSWTALVQGFVEYEEFVLVFDLFGKMELDSVKHDKYTLLALLKACSILQATTSGFSIHHMLLYEGFDGDLVACNALLDFYVKFSLLSEAHGMFGMLKKRNVITWTTVISGYAEQGHIDKALECLDQMQCDGLEPNSVTYYSLLRACVSLRETEKGQAIHRHVVTDEFESDVIVGRTLVDMYVKSGLIAEARAVFDELPAKNVVLWTTLMIGYADQGYCEEALSCYDQMVQDGVSPDAVVFTCGLRACGTLGAIDKGREMHATVTKEKYEEDPLTACALVDMYAKCGSISEAVELFYEILELDVVSWSALSAGYAHEGESDLLFGLFDEMVKGNVCPNETTFVTIFTVCSHAGLVEKGIKYFEIMIKEYNITTDINHHNCMIDLLGRAGLLYEAAAVLEGMPLEPDTVTWQTVLNACWRSDDTEQSRYAFESVLLSNDVHSVPSRLMSNIQLNAYIQQCG